MPWWHREKKDGLKDRIARIQRVNDPTTYTDEVLTASRVLIVLLLVFSGLLGAISYFRNFSISFPVEIAVFLALTLTFVIEWGKNKAATWAVRIPFFQGWASLGISPSNTFIFAGLVLVALSTFTMSVYNSTKGAEQLAVMLSHEKNSRAFAPDTKAIDEQIAANQQSVAAAPMVKWKGKMYYQDAKSVRASNKTIESLTRQREETVKLQRSDYERELAIQSAQTSFASKVVLASGGWIELLQMVLIILRVACERNLDNRHSPTPDFPTATPQKRQSPAFATAEANRIGFNIGQDGNVRSADNNDTVTQLPQSVTQLFEAQPIMTAEEALRWFETDLRREPSNLQNKHANPATVTNRICTKLSRAETYLGRCPDDSIPPAAAERFKNYLQNDLFQIVDYPNSAGIIGLLNQKSAKNGA